MKTFTCSRENTFFNVYTDIAFTINLSDQVTINCELFQIYMIQFSCRWAVPEVFLSYLHIPSFPLLIFKFISVTTFSSLIKASFSTTWEHPIVCMSSSYASITV
jgi:hypothetical protein